MDTTNQQICEVLDSISPRGDIPVIVKYGTTEAKVEMRITAIELNAKGDRVVIVVEA